MNTPARPAEPLLQALLAATDFDETFAVVKDMVANLGVNGCLPFAVAWGRSTKDAERAAGLDLLGVLADRRPELMTQLLGTVAAVPERSGSEDLRWSAAHAVSGARDSRVLAPLLRFRHDADADVRWQVVSGLPKAFDPGEPIGPDHPAVQALLEACEDPDSGVRDWAAFGLGIELDVDSPRIRATLLSLLEDDEGAAGESAVGLARRGDFRVMPILRLQLAQDPPGNLWVEAAGELADRQLLPRLLELLQDGWQDQDVRGKLLPWALERVSNVGTAGWRRGGRAG